jgi:hypothetical protein
LEKFVMTILKMSDNSNIFFHPVVGVYWFYFGFTLRGVLDVGQCSGFQMNLRNFGIILWEVKLYLNILCS